jgi:hypothetical protein
MLMLDDKQTGPGTALGAGKTYEAKDFFVAAALNVTPHKPSLVFKPLVIIKLVVAKCPKRE